MSKSFPFFQQQSELDCGAVCLQMVTRYHNRFFSLPYLKELTNFGREGVSLLDISEAGEKLGMHTLAAHITFEQLREDVPLPCIAHWQGNHFVVVYEVKEASVTVGNPASEGIMDLSRDEFLESWLEFESPAATGIALLLEPTPAMFERAEEPAKKNNLQYLLRRYGKYRQLNVQLLLGLMAVSLIQWVFPFFIRSMADDGIGIGEIRFIWAVFLAIAVLFVSQISVEFIRAQILHYMSQKVNVSMQVEYLSKLMRLPVRFFERHTIGDIMQRIGDHEQLQRFLSSSLLYSVFSAVNIILFSLVLWWFDWKIFLVFLLGTAAYLLWIRLFFSRRRELNHERFKQSALSNNMLLEIIMGMTDIKLNKAEQQVRWKWEKLLAVSSRLDTKYATNELWQSRGAFLLNELKNLTIIALAAHQVATNHLSFGVMLATMYIIGQLNTPINHLVDFVRAMQEANISLERMSEVLKAQEEDEPEERLYQPPERGAITFEDVSFQYGGNTQTMAALRELDLEIPFGKTTLILGANGSGKSTLIKLLLGIYQPTSGTIKIGEVNLATIKNQLWRSKTAVVLQDSYIFHNTIARNIALADESIDADKLLQALKVTNLQKWVDSLQRKHNSKIGEDGIGLNEGIRQKLLLARAVYKNPDYMILDEATNALDLQNETVVLENLQQAMRGKTMIIVAHRMNAAIKPDFIVVLDQGEIAESGDHSELWDRKGLYFQMVRRQLALGG
jgi:ATP-binding cassette subfamily B protein